MTSSQVNQGIGQNELPQAILHEPLDITGALHKPYGIRRNSYTPKLPMVKAVYCRCKHAQTASTSKREGGQVVVLQNYLTLKFKGQRDLIISPLPLTLKPSTYDHHLPFCNFPLNKNKHKI